METGQVYSIGHGGWTPRDLVAQLRDLGIQLLIDVRSIPYSRHQPEYSKRPLQELLEHGGIRYLFLGNLLGGRPPDQDCYIDGKVDYTRCRTKDPFLRGIQRIRTAYQDGLRVVLLCSEGKPWHCHRSKLIGEALAEEGIQVLHILPDGTILTQEQVINRITRGQISLFEPRFLSRKGYR